MQQRSAASSFSLFSTSAGLLLAVILVLAVFGSSAWAGTHAAGSPATGRSIYVSQGCSGCHGAVGAPYTLSTTHATQQAYADSPTLLANNASTYMGPLGGAYTAYVNDASTYRNDLSAYLATLQAPVLDGTAAASSSWTFGSAGSYQVVAPSGQDYLVPGSTSYSASGLPGGLSINTSTGVISGTPTAAGSFSVSVSATNTEPVTATTHAGSAANFTLTVAKAAQSLSFGAAPTVTVGATGSVSATATSGLAVSYSSLTAGVCSVSGSTVTGLAVGTCTIAANQAGNGNYLAAAQVTQNIAVGKGSQSISFGAAPTVTVGATGSVSATASSGLAVTFSSLTPAICSIAGSTVTGLNSGTCTIAANQAGNVNWLAAPQATQDFGVGAASQSISFGAAPTVSVGATGSVSATATSGLAVSFSSLTTGVCTIAGSTVTGITAGNCTIAANQAGNANYSAAPQATQTFAIGPGNQSLSFGAAPSVVVGGSGVLGATASSGLAASFSSLTPGTCTVAGTTVTGVAAGTCTVAADQPGDANYLAAPQATQSFVVGIGAQTIAFGSVPTITVGTSGTLSATATSGLAVSFASTTPATCSVSGNTVTGVEMGSCVVSADQAGDANYAAAPQVTQTFSVGPGAATANSATLQTQVNAAATLDLTPYVTGSGLTGASITAEPQHGTVEVSGLTLSYTPATDYFGADSFSYVVYGLTGTSAPAQVSVIVNGRPDPTRNAAVNSLVKGQAESSVRFARAQIANFQQRLETLHRPQQSGGSAAKGGAGALAPQLQGLGNAGVAGLHAQPASIRLDTEQPVLGRMANTTAPPGMEQPAADGESQRFAGVLVDALRAAAGSSAFHLNLGSLNPASLSPGALNAIGDGEGEGVAGEFSFWMAGTARFGRSEGFEGRMLDFTSEGVSFGADRRFGPQLVAGVGVGYGHDRAELDDNGSRGRTRTLSLSAYASYQPADATFVDAMLGYGSLDSRSDRQLAGGAGQAESDRDGQQLFGAVSAGYEYRKPGILVSPYGRLSFALTQLDEVTEKGPAASVLHFEEQTVRSFQAAVGLRAELEHNLRMGVMRPRARIEFQRDLQDAENAVVAYASQPLTRYSLSSGGDDTSALVLGVGTQLLLANGLKVDFEYQSRNAFGEEHSRLLRLVVEKEFGGPQGTPGPVVEADFGEHEGLGVSISAGYSTDNNLSRAEHARDELSDQKYSLQLGKGWQIPLNRKLRLGLAGFAGGEQHHKWRELDQLFAGGQAELQYRASGQFMAPTLGLFARATGESFSSDLRDGFRYKAGASIRQPLTQRLTLFGELARHLRNADEDTFDTRETSAKLSLDYALSRNATLYGTAEYRRGTFVATGPADIGVLEIAESFVRDDAFRDKGYVDYRVSGDTLLATLGVNVPLGPKDSIDFSWRQARSEAEDHPSFRSTRPDYIVNQFSLFYLLKF